jgi:hypothetical protein
MNIKPDAEAAMYAAYHHQFIGGFLVGKPSPKGSGANPLYTPDVLKERGKYKIHVPCTLAIVDYRLNGPRRVVDQTGGTLVLDLDLNPKAGMSVEDYIGNIVATGTLGPLTIDKWVRTGGE